MKVKELLENFKGDNHIKIYDMHSFDTHRFNNANEAYKTIWLLYSQRVECC